MFMRMATHTVEEQDLYQAIKVLEEYVEDSKDFLANAKTVAARGFIIGRMQSCSRAILILNEVNLKTPPTA